MVLAFILYMSALGLGHVIVLTVLVTCGLVTSMVILLKID